MVAKCRRKAKEHSDVLQLGGHAAAGVLKGDKQLTADEAFDSADK